MSEYDKLVDELMEAQEETGADEAAEAQTDEETETETETETQTEEEADTDEADKPIVSDESERYKRMARRLEKKLKAANQQLHELNAKIEQAKKAGFEPKQYDPNELIGRVRYGDPEAIADALEMLFSKNQTPKQDDTPDNLPLDHPFHEIVEWRDENPEWFDKAVEAEQAILRKNPKISTDELYKRVYAEVTGAGKTEKTEAPQHKRHVSLANKPSANMQQSNVLNRINNLSGEELARQWHKLSAAERAELMRNL